MVAVCVRLPETPLTRIENVPVDALLPADRVSVLVPVVLLGLNDALTPRGRAEADRRTLPLKRFCGETVMVDVTLPPRARLNKFGEAERAKFGGDSTVRESVVLCDSAPDAPVTVTVKVPSVAVLPAVTVSVLVVAVPAGLNEAVTPLGRPEAERLTLPLNPLSGLTAIVLVAFAPRTTLKLAGEAESV